MSILSEGDARFLKRAMAYFRIPRVNVGFSSSERQWPDIWCFPSRKPPVIIITEEWERQNASERRKRLVHEVVGHLAFRWIHNEFMDKVGFSTFPNKDTMSWRIYRDLQQGKVKNPKKYILEALNELGLSSKDESRKTK